VPWIKVFKGINARDRINQGASHSHTARGGRSLSGVPEVFGASGMQDQSDFAD
jgi:hypothetical protein